MTKVGAFVRSLVLAVLGLAACAGTAPPALVARAVAPHIEPAPEEDPVVPARPERGPITAVAFSPDARSLAVARADWSIEIWSIDEGARSRSLRASGQVSAITWSPDGARLGALTHNGAIVWDARSGDEIGRVPGDEVTATGGTGTVALSPDLRRAARVERDLGRVRLVDLDHPLEPARSIDAGDPTVSLHHVTADGAALVLLTGDVTRRRALVILDVAKGVVRARVDIGGGEVLSTSADGRVVAISEGRGARVIDLFSGRSTATFRRAEALSLSPDGARAIVYDHEEPQHVRDAPPLYVGALIDLKSGQRGPPISNWFASDFVTWSRDGRTLRIGDGSAAHLVRHYDVATGKRLDEPVVSLLHASLETPDGARFATWSAAGDLVVLDATNGRELLAVDANPSSPWDIAFRADGGALAVEMVVFDRGDKWVATWELDDPHPTPAAGATIYAPDLAWSNDGSLVTLDADGLHRKVYDARARSRATTARASEPDPTPKQPLVVRSPSGRYVLYLLDPEHVEVREEATGRTIEAWRPVARLPLAWTSDDLLLTAGAQTIEALDPATPGAWTVLVGMSVTNLHALGARDLPRFLRRDRLADPTLAALFARDEEIVPSRFGLQTLRSAVTLRADGALTAYGSTLGTTLVRTRDGARLQLVAFRAGKLVTLAFDEAGHVDGDDASLAFVAPARPTGDAARDAELVRRARRPGLVRAFVQGAR